MGFLLLGSILVALWVLTLSLGLSTSWCYVFVVLGVLTLSEGLSTSYLYLLVVLEVEPCLQGCLLLSSIVVALGV